MTASSFGLRGRLVAAILLIVSIVTAGFYSTVAQFIEFYESEMTDRVLVDELEQFVQQYRNNPDIPAPRTSDLRSYVVKGPDSAGLPAALRSLAAGRHGEIFIDGVEYAAGREDVGDSRIYLLLDLQRVENLEVRFLTLAWLCAVASWIAAIGVALWLSRVVLQPVTLLATQVGALDPANPHVPLAQQFGNHEIGLIAAAFDRFMLRLTEFIGREQAFTEDASHELRTPLTVIDSTAQLLAGDTTLSPQAHERVQRILRGSQQMRSLIEALLFLAREVGGEFETLALDRLVHEAADAHQEAIAQRQLVLVVKAEPTIVCAPRGMAYCVINNLLLNAIHYTEQGRIELRVAPGRLLVQDSGSGITPEDLGHIFERRYRGEQSRGLGLGLYLVKHICDRLGWTVQVSSTPGVGTRFEVYLGLSPLAAKS